jgi:hypothetical protein
MYFVLFNLLFIHSVYSHSAPACTNLQGTTCHGFARYYHFNYLPTPLVSSTDNLTFYASRDRYFQLQPGIDKVCPELPLTEYTTNFPMASAKIGQKITIQHPPRGHSSQPSSPVSIYMNYKPNQFPSKKQLNQNSFQLIGEYSYTNCVGVQQEISWANCTGTIQIPKNITSGIYSFWWKWDLNSIPYSDCFEVNVFN